MRKLIKKHLKGDTITHTSNGVSTIYTEGPDGKYLTNDGKEFNFRNIQTIKNSQNNSNKSSYLSTILGGALGLGINKIIKNMQKNRSQENQNLQNQIYYINRNAQTQQSNYDSNQINSQNPVATKTDNGAPLNTSTSNLNNIAFNENEQQQLQDQLNNIQFNMQPNYELEEKLIGLNRYGGKYKNLMKK